MKGNQNLLIKTRPYTTLFHRQPSHVNVNDEIEIGVILINPRGNKRPHHKRSEVFFTSQQLCFVNERRKMKSLLTISFSSHPSLCEICASKCLKSLHQKLQSVFSPHRGIKVVQTDFENLYHFKVKFLQSYKNTLKSNYSPCPGVAYVEMFRLSL